MSGDEVFVFLASVVVAGAGWIYWYVRPGYIVRLGRIQHASAPLNLAPLLALAVLLVVLRTLSAHDVRDDLGYVAMYTALGLAWTVAAGLATPVVGMSAVLDVHERGNRAASWAIGGAIMGTMLCYAGGNIGDGPGWWVVVFAAALATAALFATWMVFDALTDSSDSVTVDRDEAAGIRVAGLLIGCGLIFGRAAAGDWVSAAATVRDFVSFGWPALVVLAVAIFVERIARPTPRRPLAPRGPFGVVPALLYVGAALLLVAREGIPA